MSEIPFKAMIRVVKSISVNRHGSYSDSFDSVEVIREPLVYAKNEAEVRKMMGEKYPQFFTNGKVFSRETKDQAQFFYLITYPLKSYEIIELNSGEWTCAGCGEVHSNKYISRPRTYHRFSETLEFCKDYENEDACLKLYKSTHLTNVDELDDPYFVRDNSPTFIYKITEKSTGKSYIGKTRNEPFFRWWNHLTHSKSPFGSYIRTTKLSDWTFEVLEILDSSVSDQDVFEVESNYMVQFNSLNNGFNKVVSSKKALNNSLNL